MTEMTEGWEKEGERGRSAFIQPRSGDPINSLRF